MSPLISPNFKDKIKQRKNFHLAFATDPAKPIGLAKTRDDRIVQFNSNSVIIDGDAKDGAKAANIFSKSEQKTG